MADRSKLERSLDEANAAVRHALEDGRPPAEVEAYRRRASQARRALRHHREHMEGRRV